MQTLLRRTLAAALAFSATATLAQAYPDKPVTLVVPLAAGSGTDSVARAVASGLAARLKQPVIVDNKPAASAQVAAQYVAKAKPDGYTLFMTTNTSFAATVYARLIVGDSGTHVVIWSGSKPQAT